MIKFIRWQGLLGFIVLLGLLLAAWMLTAPWLIKSTIETFGSGAAGARVEVSGVSLSIDPLGFSMDALQIADADNPMQNALQSQTIRAHIALAPLLQGKVIVEELQVEGVAFAVPRHTSGALNTKEQAAHQAKDQASSLRNPLSVALPSADELLRREPLSTVATGEALALSVGEQTAQVQAAWDAVPDQATITSYKQDMAAIQQGPVNTLTQYQAKQQQLEALKKKLAADKQAIAQAGLSIKQAKAELTDKFDALKKAPAADLNSLLTKYQPNGDGVANISQLLFGDQLGGWVAEALAWHKKIRPYLQSAREKEAIEPVQKRLEGRFVAFATAQLKPDFLIRNADFSLLLPLGKVMANMQNITTQQHITKQPTTLRVQSDVLSSMQALHIDGVFDLRSMPAQNTIDVAMQAVQVANYKLGGEALMLQQANADIAGKILLTQQGVVVDGKALFSDAAISSNASSNYGKALAKILASIDHFSIALQGKGEDRNLSVHIQSDLDKTIQGAVKAQLTAKKAELESKLKAGLNDKLLTYAGPYKETLQQLNLQQTSLDTARHDIEALLTQQLAAFRDEKKAAVQDAVKDKLKHKVGGLKF